MRRRAGRAVLALATCGWALAAGTSLLAAPLTAQSSGPTGAGGGCPAVSCPPNGALPALPSGDPFYRYSGDMAGVAPGTVLKSRAVAPKIMTEEPAVDATQVLYRTTGELGQPTVTVATVIEPLGRAKPTGVVSYQDPYDGLGPECDPSYNLQAGLTPADPMVTPGAIADYVDAGFYVVVADYEGEQFDEAAGQEEGYATLDGIRAAESRLGLSAGSTPVALVGFSGGAIATDYATELAPKYAPRLDIVGAAEDGVAVDYAHNFEYVNGSPSWSEVVPAALVGLSRAFHVDLDQYLSAFGKEVIAAVSGTCAGHVVVPTVTLQELFKPQYRDIFTVPAFANMFNRLIMSRTGTPKGPLFLANGNSDGTGDGVMVAKDVEALAHTYCQRGVSVQFHEYKGLDHGQSFAPFSAGALAFLTACLHGRPVADGCSSIGPGNSLAPIKL